MKTIFNRSDYEKTLQRINLLTTESKGLWGQMTVNQMLCHSTDQLRDILGIRHTEPVTPPEMRPQIIAMVLTEEDWARDLPTFPPYLQGEGGGGTKPTNFESDKKTLLEILGQVYNSPADLTFFPHAGLGVLTRDQVGYFTWKHTDHHLREFGV